MPQKGVVKVVYETYQSSEERSVKCAWHPNEPAHQYCESCKNPICKDCRIEPECGEDKICRECKRIKTRKQTVVLVGGFLMIAVVIGGIIALANVV